MKCKTCKEELPIHVVAKRYLGINTQTDSNSNPKMIKNEENCFPVIQYDVSKIIFNITEIDPVKKNCTCLNFNKSIYYGERMCKEKPKNTFYVLNNQENTGVIKNC